MLLVLNDPQQASLILVTQLLRSLTCEAAKVTAMLEWREE